MRFPEVRAQSLLGVEHVLPADLPAERTLVLLPFQQWQQRQVDAWIALAEGAGLAPDLTEQGAWDAAVVEVPCLSRRWGPVRRFIDGGMTAGIRVPRVLARTWTTYTDVGRVQRSLGVADSSQAWVGVVLRDGEVLATAMGEPSPETWESVAVSLKPHLD